MDRTSSQAGSEEEEATSRHRQARAAAGYADIAGIGALVVGIAALAGSLLWIPSLTRAAADWPQMAPLTAAAIALCGVAMILSGNSYSRLPLSLHHRAAALACAALAALLALTRLALYLSGHGHGIDTFGLQRLAPPPGTAPSVMSVATALGTLSIGAALILGQAGRRRAADACAIVAALLSWLGLTRYLFGGTPLIPFSQMSIYTALALFVLATGVLARPADHGLAPLLFDSGPAGLSMRRLLPAALIVPMLAGVLALNTERLAGLTHDQGYALFAMSGVVTFATLVWANAAHLRRIAQERRRAEAALRDSQELLQGIIGSTDDAVITKTLAGVITSWNAAAEGLFGYSAAEAIGQPIQMIIPADRLAEEAAILASIARGEMVHHFETVRVRKDGTRAEISVTISPLRDGQGRVIGASKIARDIAERKSGERRLRAQLQRLNLLQRITQAVSERQDTDSIFRVAVRSLEDELPIDFGCIALGEAVHALQIACVGARSRLPGGEPVVAEQASVSIDENGLGRCMRGELAYEPEIAGSPLPFLARLALAGLHALVIAPLSVDGKPFGVLMAARSEPASFTSADCEFLSLLSGQLALAAHQARLHTALQRAYDDLRQTQQVVMQHERLRSLGQMASGIAHDINNALSPASLYLQFLLERDPTLSKEARDYLTIVQRAVDDVARTVARMRMFYRRPEESAALSPSDLNALLRQVLELTRVRWSDMPQERGAVIDVRLELEAGLPPIMGAENELRDGLTNLIFNAADAMRDGGTLTVRSSLQPPAPGASGDGSPPQVSVEISDTGTGMTEAVRSRCLEPFFTTKGERGSGLGLAMVYGMAQRHGAQLEILSEPGAGTTVRLVFPVAEARQALEPSRTLERPRPLRLLLVDDDPLVLKSLREVLESDGHSVVTADGGQAGIDEFRAAHGRGEPFAAVVTDLGMPAVDGRMVIAAIKATAPATPVVLLTGWGQRLHHDTEAPQLADRVLGKPPQIAELRQALAMLTG